jgi:hypothetical protein
MNSEQKLIIPPGKKAGCNPRVTKVGAICPLLSERIQVIPEREWSDLIGKIELSKCVSWIKDQDGVGSCATESTSQGVEVIGRFSGHEFEQLNPWFVYYTTSGGRDRGSSIDENLAFVRENGIAPESVWPRSKGWQEKPSDEAYEEAKRFRILEFYDITGSAEFATALFHGFPVVFGWQGHSVLAVEMINTREFRYANSWGRNWGDDGFGTLALRSVNYRYGAFAIRAITWPGLDV